MTHSGVTARKAVVINFLLRNFYALGTFPMMDTGSVKLQYFPEERVVGEHD